MTSDRCIVCARPVDAHFGPSHEWIGCVEPRSLHISGGRGVLPPEGVDLTGERAIYRFCARLKKQAA